MARRLGRLSVPIGLALALARAAGAGLPAPPAFEWTRCPSGFCDMGWYASPAAADVDGDGQVEVIWGGYRLMAVDGATGALEWRWPPDEDHGRLWPSPVVADVDGVAGPEIVIGNGTGELVVLDGSGSPRPGFPVQPFGTMNELRSLAAADLDGDGTLELLFHVWTQKGSNADGALRIVDWQANPLASVPIARNGDTWSGALGAPTLANVDADPDLEVLSGTTSMGLVAHELPGTADARIAWATSRRDFARAAPEPGAGAMALAAAAALAVLRRRWPERAASRKLARCVRPRGSS